MNKCRCCCAALFVEDKKEDYFEDDAKADHSLDCPFLNVDRSLTVFFAQSLLSMMGIKEGDELGQVKDDREGGGYNHSNHQSLATKVGEANCTLPRNDVAYAGCQHNDGVVVDQIVTLVAHLDHQDEKSTGRLDNTPKDHG